MSDFTLDRGSPEAARAFGELDEFTQGYITAMFWTDEESLAAELEPRILGGVEPTFGDLAPEHLTALIKTCADFQKLAEPLLKLAVERGRPMDHLGHDFWLTRNGHGAGFWDRKELEADSLGLALSVMCGWRTRFPEVDLYVGDDGRIYGHA